MALYSQVTRALRCPARNIRLVCSVRPASTESSQSEEIIEEEFRVFDIRSGGTKGEKKVDHYIKRPTLPPREKVMPVDQDWPSVWPGPRSFHPASVPLPLRQGHDRKKKTLSPQKYANVELMKLPNFLHLTPPAIKRHCEALKKFCTPWPQGLETDEDVKKHFPLEVITSDYCFSSPKIRDPKARIVTFKYPLSRLALNKHSKDKIQRLLGERYDPRTDTVTLTTDRCPARKQNYDYNKYLMLALYFEAANVEPWEADKGEEDMEHYVWEKNKSRTAYLAVKHWPEKLEPDELDKISLDDDETAKEYKEAVTTLFNDGENIENIFKYKEAVLKVVL